MVSKLKDKVKTLNFILLQVIVAGILTLLSCEETTSWNFEESDSFVVVDAIITNELKHHTITINNSVSSLNELPIGISGAEVTLKSRLESYSFIEDPETPGLYTSEIPFRGAAGLNFRLSIKIGNRVDSAFARMVAITPLPDPDIIPHDSLFRYNYSEEDNPSMTEITYDWTSIPQYCEEYGACLAAETFYSLNELDVNEVFAPDKKVIPFPMGTILYRTKYSLSYEHQEFIRALLLETEWRGSLFDSEQGNVPTNFQNGFRGWFALCMVQRDTVIFN